MAPNTNGADVSDGQIVTSAPQCNPFPRSQLQYNRDGHTHGNAVPNVDALSPDTRAALDRVSRTVQTALARVAANERAARAGKGGNHE